MFFLGFRSQNMISLSFEAFVSLIVIVVIIDILLALLLAKHVHEFLRQRVVHKRNLRFSLLDDQHPMKRPADNSTVVDMEPSCRPRYVYVAATIADLPV